MIHGEIGSLINADGKEMVIMGVDQQLVISSHLLNMHDMPVVDVKIFAGRKCLSTISGCVEMVEEHNPD